MRRNQKKGGWTVVLEIPAPFRAISQVYENLHDVRDEEGLDLLGMKEQE
ncbi:TPA: hypothetical protein HA351_06045 [Methanosarcinaceae archaeon]|nr:hypothetical protein [Methanosarcinaceae archaeon]